MRRLSTQNAASRHVLSSPSRPTKLPSTVKSTSTLTRRQRIGNDILNPGAALRFGAALALSNDGTVMAVGDIPYVVNGTVAGQVYVYRLTSSNKWELFGSFSKGLRSSDFFGTSMALSSDGTVLAIGANDILFGYVLVYRYSSNTWTRMGRVLKGNRTDDFGATVALSSNGNVLAVGAVGDNVGAGRVDVFRWRGNDWQQIGASLRGGSSRGFFGNSLSLSTDGSIMGVGEPGYSNGLGRARVFRFQSNVKNGWVQVGQDVLHGKFFTSQVGFSIALSANGVRIATSSLAGFTDDSADRLFVHQYNPKTQKWQQIASGVARARNLRSIFPKRTVWARSSTASVRIHSGVIS